MMQLISFLFVIIFYNIYDVNSRNLKVDSFSKERIMWAEYKKKYNLEINEKEDASRFNIFFENMKDIRRLNAENSGAVYEMNKFGHWTDKEFLNYVNGGMKKKNNEEYVGHSYTESGKKYPDIDWRKKGIVTRVKDQLKCGSCWAFCAAGQLETQYAMLMNKTIDLSEQDLVDCSGKYGNEGCNGGLMYKAFDYVKDTGINSDSDYPYVGRDMPCKHKEKKSILKVDKIFHLPVGNESALAEAVSTFGPISIGYAVTEQLKFYKRGVYVDKKCKPTEINHEMLLVGLGSKPSVHYIVKNSWGTDWGIKGYLWTARDKKDMCGVSSKSYYATVVIKK